MSISFIHLRLHTEYSLEDSLLRIETLMAAAKASSIPALTLTDQMNLFAAVKFYKSAVNAGIKPILGADISLANVQAPSQPFLLTLLCKNFEGYQKLMKLISRAYQEGQTSTSNRPLIQYAWLFENTKDLIALSGGLLGDIGQALIQSQPTVAAKQLQFWKRLFPNRFYIELTRLGKPQEALYLDAACKLANTHQVPVVATNDVRFLTATDFEAHEARVCIQQGRTLNDPKRPRLYTAQQYLRTPLEMDRLFSDIPSALQNTVEIAQRCNLELPLGHINLPHFPVPQGITVENYLIQEAEQGLTVRLQAHQAPDESPTDLAVPLDQATPLSNYHHRLKSELAIINSMGFAGYFLIVADFIRWAKNEGIPVGPGRGSGAGSLVAYALKITDVDPLKYDLLFERFLNTERVSLPDFDIDFCIEGRDRVIEYVMTRYGRESVAQIITFGTMAARAVFRDVGRVLAYPYGMVDTLAKLIPFEVGMTLDKALARDPDTPGSLKSRYKQDEEVKTLIDLARKLEGLARNAGTHAGGIVIAPTHLTAFTALYCEPGAAHALTQLDKDDIETVGLVKFDFLGLRTLTILNRAVHIINEKRTQQAKKVLDLKTLPLNDAKTFSLFQSGRTTAIFQLESRGIRALLKRLAPTHFDDIVALLALFRPGPLQSGMVEDFINRKHQKVQIQYLHPGLEPILRATYGVILYQEQVMQIAQLLAGYTLGSADLLRRAMGKKKPEEMAKQRAFFLLGAQKKAIDPVLANSIFNLIEKFAGYGFNKSHSVAYALISYQTAWLKAHYPTEFMAAVLSSEMERNEKIATLCYECYAMGISIKKPDINLSEYNFTVEAPKQIRYGLGAIKGVGHAFIEAAIKTRKERPFQDLLDLCQRLEHIKLNRRTLEAMIYSGSFDCFIPTQSSKQPDFKARGILINQLAIALQSATQYATAKREGQIDLFGESTSSLKLPTTSNPSWSCTDYWHHEKESLGLYLNTHPISQYESELLQLKLNSLYKVSTLPPKQKCFLAAWLVTIRVISTSNGEHFTILLLEDEKNRLELRLSKECYQAAHPYLIKNTLLILSIETSLDQISGETRLSVKQIWDITHARETWAASVVVRWEQAALSKTAIDDLKHALQTAQGGKCKVIINYENSTASAVLVVSKTWHVKPTDKLLIQLRQYFGEHNVWLEYRTAHRIK